MQAEAEGIRAAVTLSFGGLSLQVLSGDKVKLKTRDPGHPDVAESILDWGTFNLRRSPEGETDR